MRQTIYIDVLISINLLIDYFILRLEIKILNLDVKRKRIILASLVGGIYSLFILFDSFGFFLSMLIKLLMSGTVVLIAFGKQQLRFFTKLLAIFYFINFLFGGMVFFIWYFFSPKDIYTKNGIVYFNISPIFLIVSTGVIYLVLKVYYNFVGSQNRFIGLCQLKIKNNGQEVALQAKIDTGSDLREPFSNIPVIVAEYESIEKILSEKAKKYIIEFPENPGGLEKFSLKEDLKMRLVPFNTISNSGLLPAFVPDEITLTHKKYTRKIKAYLAISHKKIANGDFKALVNPELIP
ncbi:MAG: sigma-E processing peptidase SpoIIGA [Clostridia bacterium]|nr:sigma-E processing peptidase SpoIIGA [Clostridia bacterium]